MKTSDRLPLASTSLVGRDTSNSRNPLCPSRPEKNWCGAWKCPACGWKKALTLCNTIERIGYSALLTLTLAPPTFPRAREAMKRMIRTVRTVRTGRRNADHTELAWVVQENPGGTGHHVHALSRYDVDEDVIAEAGGRAGFGITDVRPTSRTKYRTLKDVATLGSGAGFYLQPWMSYEPGTIESAQALEDHLALNGGRLIHNTRDYFDGPRLAAMQATSEQRMSSTRSREV